ncbi:MAG: hypothetical protein KF859_08275 [Phycisphaeraceae bacterium]|nr:hypothetical protein [Phycisphaeraceae bacterium]
MSVRVLYLQRADRGATLRALRLVGLTTDQAWPAAGDGAHAPSPQSAAGWVRQQLANTRAGASLTLLCLDGEGAACSWLSSPTADPVVVAALARSGGPGLEADGARGLAAADYYAGNPMESSIEAMVDVMPRTKGRRSRGASAADAGNGRLAVMTAIDTPARLLIDALDEASVPVERVASFWHAMAMAWDVGWSPAPAREVGEGMIAGEQVAELTAVVVVDPAGRLFWCWSRRGGLLCMGSMRLAPIGHEPDQPLPPLGKEHVSRLTAEWLSWSAQLSQAPRRVVCVLSDADTAGAAEFGGELARAWPEATVDAATHADPVGATLRRVAERLEQTPVGGEPAGATGALVGLSSRPGRAHRGLYVWSAAAVAGAALLVGLAAWRTSRAAESTRTASNDLRAQWTALLTEHAPDLARPTPGVVFDPRDELVREIDRLERLVRPAQGGEPARPILDELEAISLVVGNSGYSVEEIDIDNVRATLTIIAKNIQDAVDMQEALSAVSGSVLGPWTSDSRSIPQDQVRTIYSARWPVRPASGDERGGTP